LELSRRNSLADAAPLARLTNEASSVRLDVQLLAERDRFSPAALDAACELEVNWRFINPGF
jgi:hypothetical protein